MYLFVLINLLLVFSKQTNVTFVIDLILAYEVHVLLWHIKKDVHDNKLLYVSTIMFLTTLNNLI